ncbi:MAG: hypothetical protein II287_04740, partial [Bacteroidaceae bacterium]|nr:hypothetical protein [Bacteroidaceae bacterium]
MKKTFLFAALAALSMVSCTNNELPEAEVGYGYINLNVSNDVAVTTRAGEGEVSGETTPSWIISATKNGSPYASSIINGNNVVPAGDYVISVKSHGDEATANVKNTWGEPYYEGNSGTTAIKVTAGSQQNVTIACGKPQNTKVTGQFNLTTDFKNCVLTLDPTDRNLQIIKNESDNSTSTNASAFFSAGEVKFNFSYTYGNESKTLDGKTITTTAGHEHIIRISSNDNGKITL